MTFLQDQTSSSFAGVYIPHAYGSIKRSIKEVAITYKDVFVTGIYIAGQIRMEGVHLRSKAHTKMLNTYFTAYHIEKNTKDETLVYFFYK